MTKSQLINEILSMCETIKLTSHCSYLYLIDLFYESEEFFIVMKNDYNEDYVYFFIEKYRDQLRSDYFYEEKTEHIKNEIKNVVFESIPDPFIKKYEKCILLEVLEYKNLRDIDNLSINLLKSYLKCVTNYYEEIK